MSLTHRNELTVIYNDKRYNRPVFLVALLQIQHDVALLSRRTRERGRIVWGWRHEQTLKKKNHGKSFDVKTTESFVTNLSLISLANC